MDWSTVITPSMAESVFDGIEGIIPTVVPAVVGFIGIKKALGYFFGSLKHA